MTETYAQGSAATGLHEWALNPEEAIALQRQLAPRVILEDRLGEVGLIAGVDIGFEQEGAITRAAVVVLEWPSLVPVEQVVYREPTRMPYIPGLLSFREVPAAYSAFAKLDSRPDLVMVDGQGIAHPRRLGVASHLGLWLELPTIGVAKSILCGRHDEVPQRRGQWTPLLHRNETIGVALRSRENVKPVFVSPGHRISLETAIVWVVRCLGKTKLPEPTRLADRLASRRGAMQDRLF